MLDLNLIRVFVTVYQTGSYTKAAEQLGLSQPAVSLSVKRFEKHLGQKLFAKKGRGVEATEHSKALFGKLDSALIQIENVLNPKEDLSAYCTEAALHFLGDVEDVRFLPSPEIHELELEHLRSSVVDLVIGVIDSTDPAFEVEELANEKMVVVCRSAHPRITGDTLTKDDFLAERQVTLTTRHNGIQLLDIYTQDALPARKERVEASSIASVMTMVASSNYIGVVTESFASHWCQAMNLKIMDYPFKSRPISLKLIYHKRHKSNPYHSAARQAIKQALGTKDLNSPIH
ncbi:LysR family transcriptional regulator [Vibrio astriarenae]|uniref:LysR family transcriptional regulator n=1 Tax=Vibrio astriarenae TaxID=1481923 RepID=UPI00373520B2